jgi:hypothetical protein
MTADNDAIVMRKGDSEIRFDIVIPTRNGALYCGCFMQRKREILGGAVGTGLELSIGQMHELLGHASNTTTRATAKAFGWSITRGAMKPC